jgi:hypothetical protein
MEDKFLIWLDILGFENLAKEVAVSSKVSERKVRDDFIHVINEKISEEKRKGEISGYKYGESDDWLLVLDSLDLVFKIIMCILDHSTGYKEHEKIPLEIVIGTAKYDKWTKFEGSSLTIENSTIEFLKKAIPKNYRDWFKKSHQKSITSSFVAITESTYQNMEQYDKEFCKKIEPLEDTKAESFYIANLTNLQKRGFVLKFLEKIDKESTSGYRRIERIFVAPKGFEEIKETLEKDNFVFIVGDPEIGKTYTATRILWEYFLRGYEPIWNSGSETQDRAFIRKKLRECVFKPNSVTYFEDPFGKTIFEDSEELRRTIDYIISKIQNLDAKAIITSREEVFNQFIKEKLSQKDLKALTVEMRLKKPSYDEEKMIEILTQWATEFECKWLQDESLKAFVILQARKKLTTPLSLRDFALSSKNSLDKSQLDSLINEKSKAVKAAFAEEIAKMPKEKILFLTIIAILKPVKIPIVKSKYQELCENFGFDIDQYSFESLQNHFSAKIGRDWDEDYFEFTHPSYEEGIITSWNRIEIMNFFLKILDTLIRDENPRVRGSCGVILIKNLTEFRFEQKAEEFIEKILRDKKADTRFGVADAVSVYFQNLPFELGMNYVNRMINDRNRSIRIASIQTISRNFEKIPRNVALSFFEKGLEDRAAIVRLETLGCVRSHLSEMPDKLLTKTLETNEKLTNYTGWFIKFLANIDKRILEKEIKELRKNREKINKKQAN